MRLGSDVGDVLELSIDGYQFPEAEDLSRRYSWHMVRGRARAAAETWDFRWPALTCTESPRLAAWLRAVADASAGCRTTPTPVPARTRFIEPNLAFDIESCQDDLAVIRVELDLEFRAPANRADHYAGHPNLLQISLSPQQLIDAAAAWEDDLVRYPDGLASSS